MRPTWHDVSVAQAMVSPGLALGSLGSLGILACRGLAALLPMNGNLKYNLIPI